MTRLWNKRRYSFTGGGAQKSTIRSLKYSKTKTGFFFVRNGPFIRCTNLQHHVQLEFLKSSTATSARKKTPLHKIREKQKPVKPHSLLHNDSRAFENNPHECLGRHCIYEQHPYGLFEKCTKKVSRRHSSTGLGYLKRACRIGDISSSMFLNRRGKKGNPAPIYWTHREPWHCCVVTIRGFFAPGIQRALSEGHLNSTRIVSTRQSSKNKPRNEPAQLQQRWDLCGHPGGLIPRLLRLLLLPVLLPALVNKSNIRANVLLVFARLHGLFSSCAGGGTRNCCLEFTRLKSHPGGGETTMMEEEG